MVFAHIVNWPTLFLINGNVNFFLEKFHVVFDHELVVYNTATTGKGTARAVLRQHGSRIPARALPGYL
jgi:predicted TIM-barrel enzyme